MQLSGPHLLAIPRTSGLFASFVNTAIIDELATIGVVILRIPTTYVAWVEVLGSKLYTGSQVEHLRRVSNHALRKHGMHIVVDAHSLPGVTNGLDIGEAAGHLNWFHNETNFEHSYQTISAVIDFVQSSRRPEFFSISPINEPLDASFSNFGTPTALSEQGANWLLCHV